MNLLTKKVKSIDPNASKIRLNEVGIKINIELSVSNATKWCC